MGEGVTTRRMSIVIFCIFFYCSFRSSSGMIQPQLLKSKAMCHSRKYIACQVYTRAQANERAQPSTTACCVVNHCPLAGLFRYGKPPMGFIHSNCMTGCSLVSALPSGFCSLSVLSVKCSCDGLVCLPANVSTHCAESRSIWLFALYIFM